MPCVEEVYPSLYLTLFLAFGDADLPPPLPLPTRILFHGAVDVHNYTVLHAFLRYIIFKVSHHSTDVTHI